MRTLTLLAGKISHLSTLSTTSGGSGGGGVTISTSHKVFFRIGTKPVRFSAAANFANGDLVTLVGYDGAEFAAFVLRNDSTGGTVYRSGPPQAFLVVLLWVSGLLCCLGSLFLYALASSARNTLTSEGFGLFSWVAHAFMLIGVSLLGPGLWLGLRLRSMNRQMQDLLSTAAPH